MKNYLLLLPIAVFLGIELIGCSKDKDDDPDDVFDPRKHGDYFVAPNGNDMNPGTYDKPWATWQRAFEVAGPGDTVYIRGGIYKPSKTTFQAQVTYIDPNSKYRNDHPIGNSGQPGNPICFFNYPGETPILDCERVVPDNDGNYLNGISLIETHYIHFRGLTVRNLYQRRSGRSVQGITTQACSNLKFENITVHNIGGRAMWLGSIVGYYGVVTDTMRLINLDFHTCMDSLSPTPGNAGDGIKGDGEKGGFIYFEGCRAWKCSDDGFDISGPVVCVFKNCWAFEMGFEGAVDGNGFKAGGVRDSVDYPTRYFYNCIAANNRAAGYYDLDYSPYYRTNARYYNNASYQNNYAYYAVNNPAKPFRNSIYKNNIAYKSTAIGPDKKPQEIAIGSPPYEASNNTWIVHDPRPGSYPFYYMNPAISLTDDDFESLDVSQLKRPRKADGSLPDITFLKPKPTSDLIDAGVNVGLPFLGNAPDIGVFEIK